MSFPQLTFCEEMDILLEVKKTRLMGNTDMGRRYRAMHEVRTRPLSATITDVRNKIWLLEYNFKSFPSTEEKRHWGYILYDQPKKDIKEVYCDCADFFYRLYAPFVKKKLARFDLTMKYALDPDTAYADRGKMAKTNLIGKYVKGAVQPNKDGVAMPHNRQWTIETNPSGNIYCCKHMYAALKGYVEDDETPAGKSEEVTPIKIEVSLANKPPVEKIVYIPTADLKRWGRGDYATRMKTKYITKHFNDIGYGRVNITKWL